jgi:hypothetical protein
MTAKVTDPVVLVVDRDEHDIRLRRGRGKQQAGGGGEVGDSGACFTVSAVTTVERRASFFSETAIPCCDKLSSIIRIAPLSSSGTVSFLLKGNFTSGILGVLGTLKTGLNRQINQPKPATIKNNAVPAMPKRLVRLSLIKSPRPPP